MVVTQGVYSLPSFDACVLIDAIAKYNQFGPDNDPNGERDFGSFQLFGIELMWKIDYYDPQLEFGSPDPADPDLTVRVLTVMVPSEY